jgi:hypothetical protein
LAISLQFAVEPVKIVIGQSGVFRGRCNVMKALSVVLIGVLLGASAQLAAQTSDPYGAKAKPGSDPFADPFGPFSTEGIPSNRATPEGSRPVLPEEDSPSKKPSDVLIAPLFPSFSIEGRNSESCTRIENALNSETTFDYLDQPLKDVIEDISFNHNIPIAIDRKALDDFGIDTGTPITKSIKGISLRSALRLMLRELELTYVLRDEVLQITTPETATAEPTTRFYPVADLLPPNVGGDILVDLIKTMVAPNSWSDSGGPGEIVYVEHLKTIVVRQTYELFYNIEGILATTKKLAEMQHVGILGGVSAFGGSFSE